MAAGLFEVGAARGVGDAASDAATRAGHGDYSGAVAEYTALSSKSGILYLLAADTVNAATGNAQQLELKWAQSLAASGNLDQALSLLAQVNQPDLAPQAASDRNQILLSAAQTLVTSHKLSDALLRLGQLSPASTASSQLWATADVGAAPDLVSAGQATAALALLDDAIARDPSGAAGNAATALYPQTLLSAAQQNANVQWYSQAATELQQVVDRFPNDPAAYQAQTLLDANQPLTGTVLSHGSVPFSGTIRLSSHFRSFGNSYLTSGPFYYNTTDAQGDFRFDSVPVGGPYVFEVLSGGSWSTLIDPASGKPANPVQILPAQPADTGFITIP